MDKPSVDAPATADKAELAAARAVLKPHVDHLLDAMHRLGFTPDECSRSVRAIVHQWEAERDADGKRSRDAIRKKGRR